MSILCILSCLILYMRNYNFLGMEDICLFYFYWRQQFVMQWLKSLRNLYRCIGLFNEFLFLIQYNFMFYKYKVYMQIFYIRNIFVYEFIVIYGVFMFVQYFFYFIGICIWILIDDIVMRVDYCIFYVVIFGEGLVFINVFLG